MSITRKEFQYLNLMVSMKIFVDVNTVSESNSRENWRSKFARHRTQKCIVSDAIKKFREKDTCIVTLTRYGMRRMDSDNLCAALKYVRDAVAESINPGLRAGRADDDDLIMWNYKQITGKEREGKVGVLIEVDMK